MTQFRDRTFDQRFGEMGDEAEGHFEEWCEREKIGFARYGLNRPNVSMQMLPARLRYTPDYLMSKKFVEVQGFGRDQTVKLKLDKWGALHWWNDLHPVDLYLWDSTNKRECFIGLFEFDALLGREGASLGSFREGKPFFELPADVVFAAVQ